MNNLSSYCGLVDAKIKSSDKDLPIFAIFAKNPINPDPPKKLHNRTDPMCRKWMQISKFVFSKYSGQPKSNIKIQIEMPRIDLL